MKYRYKLKCKQSGTVHDESYTIDQIENGIETLIDHSQYEVLDRHRYTGIQDRNTIEIYETDNVKISVGSNKYAIYNIYYLDGAYWLKLIRYTVGSNFPEFERLGYYHTNQYKIEKQKKQTL